MPPHAEPRPLIACATLAALLHAATAGAAALPFDAAHRPFVVIAVTVNDEHATFFALDTASSVTVVSPELAARTQLTVRGTRLARTLTDTRALPVTHLAMLGIGSQRVEDLDVLVSPLRPIQDADPRVQGILGQDVLRRWSYLLDYRNGVLHLDPARDLTSQVTGERIPITWVGNRPLIAARLMTGTGRVTDVQLALDTAAASLTLYTPGGRQIWERLLDRVLGFVLIRSIHGSEIAARGEIARVTIGSTALLRPVLTITRRPEGWRARREGGLLPARLFDAIYVDDGTDTVILNPTLIGHAAAGDGPLRRPDGTHQ
jgi:hypothetical protein